MRAALDGRRLGRRVRRVGVRDGGRRVRHRGPARPARRSRRRTTSTPARSWPTTSRGPGSSRGPRTMPTNPDGATQLRRVQGRSPRPRCWPATGDRIPGIGRPAGGDLRAGQQHLRHGTADVPAPAPAPADPRAARRARRRVVRARRRSLRGDGRRWSATRQPAGEVFNISGRFGRRESLHRRCSPTWSAPSPTSCTSPTTCSASSPPRIAAVLRPPVRHPPPRRTRHRARRSGCSAHASLRPAHGPRADVRVVPRPRATTELDGADSSIRCGGRRGTSTSRPLSPSRIRG